ncbi:MAG: hypothetical protein DYG88_03900 [Chloroflexi bacterium CFX4]|nr:hypothetical protein [Chloroflexi bacterium CFX4]MDL1921086.1 hypothetical protein [Chloroflexi bacterium CFX3]
MLPPSRQIATQIIQNLGQYGTPLSGGVGYYNVGTESLLEALDKHYLSSYLPEGGAVFKLVVGDYGSGKSHFLYCVRERAWARRFAVSKVDLSPQECPYDDQKKVYSAVAKALIWHDADTSDSEMIRGLAPFLDRLLQSIVEPLGAALGTTEAAELDEVQALQRSFNNTPIDNISYRYAISHYLSAALYGNAAQKDLLARWLHGEDLSTADMRELKTLGVTQKMTRTNAFQMLRSLSQTVRALGFNGLCLLFDEVDRLMSLTRRAMTAITDNLREVIDRTREDLPGTLFIYAVLPQFVSDIVPSYPALQQRLQVQMRRYFSLTNPFSPQINLDHLDLPEDELLVKIAERLRGIFETAYNTRLNATLQTENARHLALAALRTLSGISHRRIFIKALIGEWYHQMQTGESALSDSQAEAIIGSGTREVDGTSY